MYIFGIINITPKMGDIMRHMMKCERKRPLPGCHKRYDPTAIG